jgi:hypothetical protein
MAWLAVPLSPGCGAPMAEIPSLTLPVPDPSAFVQLADGTAFYQPAHVTWHTEGLEIDFVFEVVDGRPKWSQMHVHPAFRRTAAEVPELTATRIRELPLDAVAEEAVRQVARIATGYTLGRHPGDLPIHVPGEYGGTYGENTRAADAAGDAAVNVRRKRRKMTDELLRRVSDTVRSDETGAPRQAVAAREFSSTRTASRLIAEARKRGFLGEEEG